MHRRLLVVTLALGACGDARLQPPADAALIDAAEPPPVDAARDASADARVGAPPAVIVLIGDGMGVGQLDVASMYRHGATGRLAMQQLPFHGQVRTGSPSGITDSAAAASVMATGAYTYNGGIGVDRRGRAVETLVERAQARSWATGVVTTTSLPHATPAGFTAHVASRGQYVDIADQMVRDTHPDVMLGGGWLYFRPTGADSVRTDDGLYDELDLAGYTRVDSADALNAAVAAGAPRLFGDFAADQMAFVASRPHDSTEPTLPAMAMAALATLDRDPHGFFVMIEGGRIDHGGHANSLVDVVQETLAFDDTVAQVTAWARARGNTTVLITADHETGGLELVGPAPIGTYPPVRWRWGNHTNSRVPVFGEGPGAALVDGAVIDHRWIYAIARARLDSGAMIIPAREPVPDGELGELRHRAAVQTVASEFGAGLNQLDALWLDATADGLYLGVEGLFAWGVNATEVWIDVDPGANTGAASPAGAVTDTFGVVDRVLASSQVSAPAVAFGADLAVVSIGGGDPHVEDFRDDAGARALHPPFGQAMNLGWLRAAINFGAVRTRALPMAPVAGQGMEVFLPWSALYPGGVVPVGARLRLAVVLANTTGEFTSNQFLPGLPPGSRNPGVTLTPLPGVIEYALDADRDGMLDGDTPPIVLR